MSLQAFIDTDPDNVRAPLHAASCTYRIAFGPREGHKVLSVQPVSQQPPPEISPRCVGEGGFSLHAKTFCPALDRATLERLCRYLIRPALAHERVTTNDKDQVVLKLKSPYRDGNSHIIMEPREFMQRLAALVPRPRLNLTRFHGVLVPNHKLRAEVVPKQAATAGLPAADDGQPEAEGINSAWRISWARLLKRVFNIDIETCSHCQGRLKIIAAITSPAAITKILIHLGLSAQLPPIAPAWQGELFAAG